MSNESELRLSEEEIEQIAARVADGRDLKAVWVAPLLSAKASEGEP